MGSGSYHAWAVREEDFPRSGSMVDQLGFLLRYAVLAPSAHNTQPWTFRIEGNHIALYPDFSRALSVSDPTHRELYLSLGCALANLLVAADHFGFRTVIEEFPPGPGNPVARVAVVAGGHTTPQNDALFSAIPRRHTNRGRYESRAVPIDILQRLRGQVGDAAVRLDIVTQQEKIQALANLTAQATLETLGRSDFRAELSQRVRNNFTRKQDGMPGFSVGVPALPSFLAPFMVRVPKMATVEAKKARDLIGSSPLVAVISTREDTSSQWVKAGMALERIALAATAAGLRSAPYAGPFEAGKLHEHVELLLGVTGYRAQTLLRIGYGPPDPRPSPRRPAEDVTVSADVSNLKEKTP